MRCTVIECDICEREFCHCRCAAEVERLKSAMEDAAWQLHDNEHGADWYECVFCGKPQTVTYDWTKFPVRGETWTKEHNSSCILFVD